MADANGAEERNILDADPYFIEPDDAVLNFLQLELCLEFVDFPEAAIRGNTYAPEVIAVYKFAHAPLAQATCLGGCPFGSFYSRSLLEEVVVVLELSADVDVEILVRGFNEEAVFPGGDHAQVRADLVPLGSFIVFCFLFRGFLLGEKAVENLGHVLYGKIGISGRWRLGGDRWDRLAWTGISTSLHGLLLQSVDRVL